MYLDTTDGYEEEVGLSLAALVPLNGDAAQTWARSVMDALRQLHDSWEWDEQADEQVVHAPVSPVLAEIFVDASAEDIANASYGLQMDINPDGELFMGAGGHNYAAVQLCALITRAYLAQFDPDSSRAFCWSVAGRRAGEPNGGAVRVTAHRTEWLLLQDWVAGRPNRIETEPRLPSEDDDTF